MSSFTVTFVSVKREVPDAQYGPAIVYSLVLDDGTPNLKEAEWFTKATTPAPRVGDKLEGELKPGKFGLSFKKTQAGGAYSGGAGSPRQRDPAERRSIQAQHAQKCAVEILKLAAEHGDYKPTTASDAVKQTQAIAKALVDQIEQLAA